MTQPGTTSAAEDQLIGISTRLGDVAATVAREAGEATTIIRNVVDHARDIAMLAEDLKRAALLVEASIQSQMGVIARAGSILEEQQLTVGSIGDLAQDIAAISGAIDEIAGRSRALSLNARIEAARAGDAGKGFDAVANEMASLAIQTKGANEDIAARAQVIGGKLGGVNAVISASDELVKSERDLLHGIVQETEQQLTNATMVASLTTQTVDHLDDAASRIGRVEAAATVASLLARQIQQIAGTRKA